MEGSKAYAGDIENASSQTRPQTQRVYRPPASGSANRLRVVVRVPEFSKVGAANMDLLTK